MGDTSVSAGPLALGIAELGQAFRSGTLSPVEVVEALFDEIARDSRDINAFCHLDCNAAIAAARASGERHRAGSALGPLDGIPVSIKDLVNVAGWPTRRGSLACAGEPDAAADSPAVAHLRAAGAVIFGKTTTTEFGWTVISDSPHSGRTRNPLDPSRSAGGSSCGAAAQLAAGWGPLALGSDAGGSVRIPASYCGVVGFKPTFGAIPLAPQSAFAEFAHLGPMTRTVQDCMLAMQVLAQPDVRDPSSLFPRADALPARPLRLGWTTRLGGNEAPAPQIEAAFRQLLQRLEQAGYQLQELALDGEHLSADMWQVWCSRVFESFEAWPSERRALLDAPLQRAYAEGEAQAASGLARSRAALRGFSGRIADAYRNVDLILTPTTPTTAPLFEQPGTGDAQHVDWFGTGAYTYPFTLTQLPALSLPLGRGEDGMPFGVQIAGRKYQDDGVLAFGAELERLLGKQK